MSDLSLAQARAVAVASQGVHNAHQPVPASSVLDKLACIQLDSIAVVRRSHELVLLARHVPDAQARTFLDPREPPRHFEYWAHAASVVPVTLWPYFALRRRRFRSQGWRGPKVDPAACDVVRAAVAEQGQVTISDLGGAKGSGWERSAPAKWAVEWLLATGELVCLARRRFSRIYQSAAALPAAVQHDADDDECVAQLVQVALDALGVGTSADIADYFRLPHPVVRKHLHSHHGAPVRVEGWREPAWLSRAASTVVRVDEDACTPLSPFDSLLWYRSRARRLFGVDYLLEAYKPATQRQCGYFGMPVLAGTRIVGRIALRNRGGTAALEGHQLIHGCDPDRLWHAAQTAAGWAGATLTATSRQIVRPGDRP